MSPWLPKLNMRTTHCGKKTKVADLNMAGGSRKTNWSEAEILLLMEQVEQKKELLKGKFLLSLSVTDKTEA